MAHLVDEDHAQQRNRKPGSVEERVAPEADHERDQRPGGRDLEYQQQRPFAIGERGRRGGGEAAENPAIGPPRGRGRVVVLRARRNVRGHLVDRRRRLPPAWPRGPPGPLGPLPLLVPPPGTGPTPANPQPLSSHRPPR